MLNKQGLFLVFLVTESSQSGEQKPLKGREADKAALRKMIQDDLRPPTWTCLYFGSSVSSPPPPPEFPTANSLKPRVVGRPQHFLFSQPPPFLFQKNSPGGVGKGGRREWNLGIVGVGSRGHVRNHFVAGTRNNTETGRTVSRDKSISCLCVLLPSVFPAFAAWPCLRALERSIRSPLLVGREGSAHAWGR